MGLLIFLAILEASRHPGSFKVIEPCHGGLCGLLLHCAVSLRGSCSVNTSAPDSVSAPVRPGCFTVRKTVRLIRWRPQRDVNPQAAGEPEADERLEKGGVVGVAVCRQCWRVAAACEERDGRLSGPESLLE